MGTWEIAIWSAACGAIGMVILVCLVDFAVLRTRAAAQGAAYNVATFLFVALLSGLPARLFPALPTDLLQVLQVLVGPLCVLLGNHWVRQWFGARHRDRLMDSVLVAAGTLAPLAGLACLLLPRTQQLPASAAIAMLNSGIVLWMSVRAWLLGDALALGIAIGAVLMLPAVGGLYAVALNVPGLGIAGQALIALAAVLCISVIGFMLWKRNQRERRTRGFEPVQSQYDPVTRLPAGLPLVRQLVQAQGRRRRTRRDGAVIAVLLFEPERIVAQAGPAGLNEAYQHIAQRLQRQIGVVNTVGRYWERCFVALVETIHSPAAMRTLGLRVASGLRRPMEIKGPGGQPLQVRLDIGVGLVHMGRQPAEVDDLLHEAQMLAEASRAMASRAAVRDPASGRAMPVEQVDFGPRQPVRSRRHDERRSAH
jgi:GGDEF domain-containing protein